MEKKFLFLILFGTIILAGCTKKISNNLYSTGSNFEPSTIKGYYNDMEDYIVFGKKPVKKASEDYAYFNLNWKSDEITSMGDWEVSVAVNDPEFNEIYNTDKTSVIYTGGAFIRGVPVKNYDGRIVYFFYDGAESGFIWFNKNNTISFKSLFINNYFKAFFKKYNISENKPFYDVEKCATDIEDLDLCLLAFGLADNDVKKCERIKNGSKRSLCKGGIDISNGVDIDAIEW